MSRIVVCTGRGGTGKTTFVALCARLLGHHPLLIDADSDQSLPEALGLDLSSRGLKTVSDILYDIQRGTIAEDFKSMNLPDRIELLCNRSCLYESSAFDLMAIGVKWTRGCYCMPNNILRAIIPELASSYEYTLIDAPAGLEHLNRRIVSDIDDLFVIADPSSKALANIKRLREVSRQVGIVFKHLYLVGNYRFDASTESFLRDSGEHYVGRVAPDPNVAEYNLRGQALSDLPMDSDAVQSVRSILLSTGFPLENEG